MLSIAGRARRNSAMIPLVARRETARAGPKMKRKTVYLNGTPIGSASTWYEVALLLSRLLRRNVTFREAVDHGSEGPDGFYIVIPE